MQNLTEKIDASVNIIATLKAVMEENEDKNARAIVEELKLLEADVKNIAEDTKLEEFKLSLPRGQRCLCRRYKPRYTSRRGLAKHRCYLLSHRL